MIKKVGRPSIRPKLTLVRWLTVAATLLAATLLLVATLPAAALDAVSIQLKWKHQFQFAGYHHALEQVKGRKTKFMLYVLLALRASDDPELMVLDRQYHLSDLTWQASLAFEAGEFQAAERAYREVLREFPQDSLAKFMVVESVAQTDLAAGPSAYGTLS